MISLTFDKLKEQHINLKQQSEFVLDGVRFAKKKVISKRHKKDAIRLIEEYTSGHLEAILVEHKLFFSIWLEQSAMPPSSVGYQSDVPQQQTVEAEEDILKAIDLLDSEEMKADRVELEDLVSSRLKELGL